MHVSKAGDAGVLQPRQVILPPPGPSQVRVKIEAAGVAYADIVMRRGLYSSAKPPVTPGYDFVGRVEAVGAEGSAFQIGQRVAGVTVSGSYADRRNVEARWLVPAPEEADAAALAAVVLNGVTAWQMLHRVAQAGADEWILVHGAAGGVGSLLLDFARLAGIKAIGAASRGKHDTVQSRGGVALDYQAEDVAARARAISGGGVVAAFDHIGGRHFRKVSLLALKPTGVGVLYGGYDATRGGKVHPLAIADMMLNSRFSAFALFGKSQSVATYAIPAWRDLRAQIYRDDLATVLKLVAEGAISPLVGEVLPLRDAAKAHRAMESRSVSGKIVLIP
ncbi:alcohol dehydrogenase [Sphingobium terrigena]|uniref:Alcohol dehydrogenase n=2 Tax=Sphingobium terrigena TaxID=2304063 RepID=A0A418YV90_9SPHN|nr:alcohol dehydrogenase [Sphingobium terrigena]